MIITTGHFSLFPILDFAAANPTLPSNKSPRVKADYNMLRRRIVADVRELPGWYLWGRLNDMGGWQTVYVGMTTKRQTSNLRARLYERLWDGSAAFWVEVYGSEPTFRQKHDIYPHGRYDRYDAQNVSMSGARVVLWIGVEDEISWDEIRRQENLLMNMYEPTANISRPNRHAIPDDLTRKIQNTIEHELSRMIESTN
jgi:hypothetical protein